VNGPAEHLSRLGQGEPSLRLVFCRENGRETVGEERGGNVRYKREASRAKKYVFSKEELGISARRGLIGLGGKKRKKQQWKTDGPIKSVGKGVPKGGSQPRAHEK